LTVSVKSVCIAAFSSVATGRGVAGTAGPTSSRRGWFTEGLDTPDLRDAKALLEEIA
jgi:hypothetical protein